MEFGSEIRNIRDALVEKIKAAVGPDILVDRFAGEERAMESACPSVYVQFAGGIAQESQEIGAVSYQYDTIWLLHIQTEDNPRGADGDEQAAWYLGVLRNALHSSEVAGGIVVPHRHEVLNNQTEGAGAVHAGRYLYGQCWRIEQFVE